MRILVTGGAGFLGSHLCERLLKDGHEVVALDNLFTGRKLNIAHLMGHANFEFVRHDVIDPFKYEVDQIYNLACPASPPHYQYNPIKTIKTSVMGAINCLGLAKRTKARVFQASTSEVYGDPQIHPQPESYWGHVNPIGKRSCYDEGKRCAETLFFDYHRENKVDIRVIRIFNTYGPRMHEADGRVVSNFIVQALRGQDITIYGDGSQTRSFCYVDDLIEGFLRFMAQTETVGPMNLGNPGANWVSTLGILLAGLFLTMPYILTRQLWISIGLHIGWNFSEGVIYGLPVSGIDTFHIINTSASGSDLLTGGAFGPEAGLVLIPALALGAFLVWRYAKFNRTSAED